MLSRASEHLPDYILKRREENKKSFSDVRKIKGHRFLIPRYSSGFLYYEMGMFSYWGMYRKTLPMTDCSKEEVQRMMSAKMLQWHYPYEYKYHPWNKTRYPVLPEVMPVVLDVDVKCEEVKKKALEWSFAKRFPVLVVESGGGNAHVVIFFDMSSEASFPNYSGDPEVYLVTNRWKAYSQLRTVLAESFEGQTGLLVDRGALERNTITPTFKGISEINAFWRKHKPVNYAALKKAVTGKAEVVELKKATLEVGAMGEEFKEFLESDSCVDEVMSYCSEAGVVVGQKKQYEVVKRLFLKHFNTIVKHWANKKEDMAYLRYKASEVGIRYETVNGELFGLDTLKYRRTVRHFAMYIFGMALEKEYVYKEKTNLYIRSEIEREYFSNDFLRENWYCKTNIENVAPELTPDSLSEQLGNSNTYETIEKQTPRLVSLLGPREAKEVMIEAIWQSAARDKRQRIQEVRGYVSKLMRWWNLDEDDEGVLSRVRVQRQTHDRGCSVRPEPGGVPSSRLFDSELAFGEEAG